MVEINRIISLVLLYGLLLFGFIQFVIYGAISLIMPLTLLAFGLVVYTLIDRMELNADYKIFIGLAIWLNALAYGYLYTIYPYFCYFIHFVDGFLITFMVYDYYKKNFVAKEIYIFLFVFLSVIGIISVWEVYEYCINIVLHMRMQGTFTVSGNVLISPLDDTMLDITIGILSSLLALTIKENISNQNKK